MTSGHSNPWECEPSNYNPKGPSGRGVEFVVMANEASDWAVRFLLHMLACDLLLVTQQLGERRQFEVGALVPLGGAIDGAPNGSLRNAFVVVPENLPQGFELPSGVVNILTFVGIGDEEFRLGKEMGGNALITRLQSSFTYPVTIP